MDKETKDIDIKELAEMICSLPYEKQYELYKKIEIRLFNDGVEYENYGNARFGAALQAASNSLEDVIEYIRQAWAISKPFMEDKLLNK